MTWNLEKKYDQHKYFYTTSVNIASKNKKVGVCWGLCRTIAKKYFNQENKANMKDMKKVCIDIIDESTEGLLKCRNHRRRNCMLGKQEYHSKQRYSSTSQQQKEKMFNDTTLSNMPTFYEAAMLQREYYQEHQNESSNIFNNSIVETLSNNDQNAMFLICVNCHSVGHALLLIVQKKQLSMFDPDKGLYTKQDNKENNITNIVKDYLECAYPTLSDKVKKELEYISAYQCSKKMLDIPLTKRDNIISIT